MLSEDKHTNVYHFDKGSY